MYFQISQKVSPLHASQLRSLYVCLLMHEIYLVTLIYLKLLVGQAGLSSDCFLCLRCTVVGSVVKQQ